MTDNKAPPDVILNGTMHIHLTYLSSGQVVINFYFLGLILTALDRQTGIYFTMNSFCQQFQLLALPFLAVLPKLSISSSFEELWPSVPIKGSFQGFPSQRHSYPSGHHFEPYHTVGRWMVSCYPIRPFCKVFGGKRQHNTTELIGKPHEDKLCGKLDWCCSLAQIH